MNVYHVMKTGLSAFSASFAVSCVIAQQKGITYAGTSLNRSQAVLRVDFTDETSQGETIGEDANEGEK